MTIGQHGSRHAASFIAVDELHAVIGDVVNTAIDLDMPCVIDVRLLCTAHLSHGYPSLQPGTLATHQEDVVKSAVAEVDSRVN